LDGAGQIELTHPTRPDRVYLVPDYISGRMEYLTVLMLAQIALFGYPFYSRVLRRTRRARLEAKTLQAASLERIEAMRRRRAEKSRADEADGDQNVWRPKH
jgi:Tfp pilus assembly protein FimT